MINTQTSNCLPRDQEVSDTSNPDAVLIALCADFDRLERGYRRLVDDPRNPISDEEEEKLRGPLRAAQEPLIGRILEIQASTLAGLRAKAATLVLWDCETLNPWANCWNDLLKASIIGDILGIDGTDPDAARATLDSIVAGTFAVEETVAEACARGDAA